MTDFPIVDSHVHLWDPERFRMEWLDDVDLLNRPYGLAEYHAHTTGLPIEAMVYLQVEVAPAYALLEAKWVIERAAEDDRIKGIVAWAPLEFGEQARAFLGALAAVDPRIKGIRRIVQDEPDPEYCLRPRFVRGVQMLPEFDLSFDICIRHHQLKSAVELVRRCPRTSFILDHIGKPDIAHQLFDPWRAEIHTLASLPNVMCKISGLATEADHARWTTEDLKPYVEHVIECFGEDRVAFGGDWPVVLQASTYRRWVDTLHELTGELSAEGKRKLWAENASRFYRLSSWVAGE